MSQTATGYDRASSLETRKNTAIDKTQEHSVAVSETVYYLFSVFVFEIKI